MLSTEYIIILILILVSIFIKPIKKVTIPITIAYMFIIGFCRDITVGTDVYGYYDDWCRLSSLEYGDEQIRHSWEWGYQALILLFKTLSNDYLLFIGLTFIPFFWCVIKFIKDSKVDVPLALFVFFTFGFYFIGFNAMRQMIASAIILSAFPLLYKQKYVLFAIITILTSFAIHKSETIFLALIPLHYFIKNNNVHINKKLLYVMIIGSFSVYYIGNTFFRNFFFLLSSFLPQADHYEGYIMADNQIMGSNGFAMAYSLFSLFLVWVKNKSTYVFETYVYVFSIVIFNIFNTFSTYGARIFIDFHMIAIVLVPFMLKDKGTKMRKIFFFVILVFGIGKLAFSYYINNSDGVNPYIFRHF